MDLPSWGCLQTLDANKLVLSVAMVGGSLRFLAKSSGHDGAVSSLPWDVVVPQPPLR